LAAAGTAKKIYSVLFALIWFISLILTSLWVVLGFKSLFSTLSNLPFRKY